MNIYAAKQIIKSKSHQTIEIFELVVFILNEDNNYTTNKQKRSELDNSSSLKVIKFS